MLFSIVQILFEYSDTFMKIDADAYIKLWPKYAQQRENIIRTQYAASNFHTQWSQEIHNIFILVKLLPPKFGRKQVEGRETFNDAIEKLIVFRTVSV